MNNQINQLILAFACVFVFSLGADAQVRQNFPAEKKEGNVASTVLKGTGKVAVIIVGSAAKGTYKTTKFVATGIARPVITEVAPSTAKFILKRSAKFLLPYALKLSLL